MMLTCRRAKVIPMPAKTPNMYLISLLIVSEHPYTGNDTGSIHITTLLTAEYSLELSLILQFFSLQQEVGGSMFSRSR